MKAVTITTTFELDVSDELYDRITKNKKGLDDFVAKNCFRNNARDLLSAKTGNDSQQYFLLFVWGDVEPELLGPFKTPEERDREAVKKRYDDPEGRHGIFGLDMKDGSPEVWAYSGGFMDKEVAKLEEK